MHPSTCGGACAQNILCEYQTMGVPFWCGTFRAHTTGIPPNDFFGLARMVVVQMHKRTRFALLVDEVPGA